MANDRLTPERKPNQFNQGDNLARIADNTFAAAETLKEIRDNGGTGGDGDMKAKVYDPTGKADDAFNHKNHYGNHFLVSTAQQETAGSSEFQVDTAVTGYSIIASNSVSAFPVARSSASITGAVNLSTGNATATMDFSSINGDATPGKVFITVNGQNLPANSVIGTDADFGFTTYPAPPSGGQPGQVLGMGSDGRLAWIDLPTAAKA